MEYGMLKTKRTLMINHYVDKKATVTCLNANQPKLELRMKSVIITDNETTIFACKFVDFISMSF